MTVEERAQNLIDIYQWWTRQPQMGKEDLKQEFSKILRDQIEECAKVAGAHHGNCTSHCHAKVAGSEIAVTIRALAAPGEEKEGER